MVSCFFGGPGFFQEHSQLWSSLLPSLQAVSSQPTTVSPCVHSPNPTFQHPAPLPSNRQQLRLEHAGLQSGTSMLVLICPTCHRISCCAFLQAPEAPLLSQLICPMSRGLPECRNLFCPSAPHQGCRYHSVSLFLFSSLSPTQLCDFSCPFRCPGPLLVYSRHSVRIAPFLEVFLMYLWGQVNSISFYSAFLTPSPSQSHSVETLLVFMPLWPPTES